MLFLFWYLIFFFKLSLCFPDTYNWNRCLCDTGSGLFFPSQSESLSACQSFCIFTLAFCGGRGFSVRSCVEFSKMAEITYSIINGCVKNELNLLINYIWKQNHPWYQYRLSCTSLFFHLHSMLMINLFVISIVYTNLIKFLMIVSFFLHFLIVCPAFKSGCFGAVFWKAESKTDANLCKFMVLFQCKPKKSQSALLSCSPPLYSNIAAFLTSYPPVSLSSSSC